MIRERFSNPLTHRLDIDSPHITQLRKHIIQHKNFLRKIYREWYASIISTLPEGDGPVIELGSGPGFFSELLPDVITSEIFYCPGVRVVLDGQDLPFRKGALRAIVMIDVLHHLPRPRRFFAEARRCVQAGGVLVMIEPWVTPWSRMVYTKFHPEPFDAEAQDWGFSPKGPLSGANIALPWIIFQRDCEEFEKEFPEWEIKTIKTSMPFRYLVSGGLSLRSFMPGWTFSFWSWLEKALQPWMCHLAMFAQILLLRKKSGNDNSLR